jgi:hypothetical protein
MQISRRFACTGCRSDLHAGDVAGVGREESTLPIADKLKVRSKEAIQKVYLFLVSVDARHERAHGDAFTPAHAITLAMATLGVVPLRCSLSILTWRSASGRSWLPCAHSRRPGWSSAWQGA